MGFFNDFIRGATPAIEGGTNIGLRGMAEVQRKRELQDEIQRQTQQQAFVNMMNQQKFDAEQQQAAQGQQNWQQQFDTQNFNNQQGAIDDATKFRMGLENQLKQNNFEQQRLDLSKQQVAQGGNPSFEETLLNMLPEDQRQQLLQSFVQNKYKPANGSQGGSALTPSNMLSLRGQMMNPLTGGNPQTPMSDVTNMAGQIQRTTDSLNTANAGAPMPMQQTPKPQHPAIQKMLQDGVTMQMILQDFMQNQQEYEAQGITLEMLQGQ